MAWPNLKIKDPTLLKISTEDDEIEKLKNKTEKREVENSLKSIKNRNEHYWKKNNK